MKIVDRRGIDALVHDRELLTVEQAAAYLQIHKVTLYKYIRSGALRAAKLGKVYRIFRRDLEALVEAARTEAPRATGK